MSKKWEAIDVEGYTTTLTIINSRLFRVFFTLNGIQDQYIVIFLMDTFPQERKKEKTKTKNKTNSRGELNLHNNVQKPIIRKVDQKIVSNSLAKLAPKIQLKSTFPSIANHIFQISLQQTLSSFSILLKYFIILFFFPTILNQTKTQKPSTQTPQNQPTKSRHELIIHPGELQNLFDLEGNEMIK